LLSEWSWRRPLWLTTGGPLDSSQRTINPLIAPTRYNFPYSSFKAGPAGGLRPPSGPSVRRDLANWPHPVTKVRDCHTTATQSLSRSLVTAGPSTYTLEPAWMLGPGRARLTDTSRVEVSVAAFNYEAINRRGFFIRHRNSLGELTRQQGPIDDFAFMLEHRDPVRRDLVSFSSVNFLGKYLRHSNFRIHLNEIPPTTGNHATLFVFLQDSSFFRVRGLADPNGVSFRSFNLPDHFLRHRDFHLFVDHKDSPNLAADATFLEKRASVPIDPGTVLNPVVE
jgi:Alpha-L-arabinofuranosidase B (ABFB) domain